MTERPNSVDGRSAHNWVAVVSNDILPINSHFLMLPCLFQQKLPVIKNNYYPLHNLFHFLLFPPLAHHHTMEVRRQSNLCFTQELERNLQGNVEGSKVVR